LDCGSCPILILACDGVWDVLNDQEAADLLLERYLTDGPFEQAAELLVILIILFPKNKKSDEDFYSG
jgi:serine/threonine protein phosphatase PrpC